MEDELDSTSTFFLFLFNFVFSNSIRQLLPQRERELFGAGVWLVFLEVEIFMTPIF
jgi:hypothetical protein